MSFNTSSFGQGIAPAPLPKLPPHLLTALIFGASTKAGKLFALKPRAREDVVLRADAKLNLSYEKNPEAIYAHVNGAVSADSCKQCLVKHGPFHHCIVLDHQDMGSKACTNCYYNNEATYCTLLKPGNQLDAKAYARLNKKMKDEVKNLGLWKEPNANAPAENEQVEDADQGEEQSRTTSGLSHHDNHEAQHTHSGADDSAILASAMSRSSLSRTRKLRSATMAKPVKTPVESLDTMLSKATVAMGIASPGEEEEMVVAGTSAAAPVVKAPTGPATRIISVDYINPNDPYCTKQVSDADRREGSGFYFKRQQAREGVVTIAQIQKYAKIEAKKWEDRMDKNFPIFMVNQDGSGVLIKGSAPKVYLALAREVIRRCNPDGIENDVYSIVAVGDIELENLWISFGGDFSLDNEIRALYPLIKGNLTTFETKWEVAESRINRRIMLQYRTGAFFVLLNHPFYMDSDYCTQAKLRGLFICLFDRIYTNRYTRLILGHSVETKPRASNPFLDDLVMHLGYDASIQSPLGRVDLSENYAEDIMEANWDIFCKLQDRPVVPEDLAAKSWDEPQYAKTRHSNN